MPVVGRPCLETEGYGFAGPGLPRVVEPSPERGPGRWEAVGQPPACGSMEQFCPAPLSLQILGLTFAMTMYCQVLKADTYCA